MNYEERFDLGDDVICIKEFDKMKIGSRYHINGCGNLLLSTTNKSGYGFSIEVFYLDNGKLLPKTYYFTLEEMDEYFITLDENLQIHIRDSKIQQIIK